MPHNYTNLSPSEFETLAADILSAEHSVTFERYGEGPDGGIDCRHESANGEVWIGQAKRYKNVAALLRALPKEQKKMQALEPRPSRYFLVTACSLSPGNKHAIRQAMQPFIQATADIYGADDLDARLDQYPLIYRKHYRLWLHGVEQLNQYLNRAQYARTEMVHERLLVDAKSYVVPAAQAKIDEQLTANHCCLIIGDPGSGKSTVAGQLALQLQIDNPRAELVWIDDRDVAQALQLIRPDSDQILVLDDFLGATFLDTVGILAFQRDWQTLLFKAAQANGKLKLLFTTRTYILEQAVNQLGGGQRAINQLCRQAVDMQHSNAWFRAELVYRLIHSAGFTQELLSALLADRLYWVLIKAESFSPRLIRMFCEKLTTVTPQQLRATVEEGIEGQQQLWQEVFQRLSAEAQALLYLCGLAGINASVGELKHSFNTLYHGLYGRVAALSGFDKALLELEPTFITTAQHLDEIWVGPTNPSLVDFMYNSIAGNHPLIEALIQSLEHFDWGLRSFKITESSSNPIVLKRSQQDALLDKQTGLLTQPGSNLMQMLQADSVGWSNRPATFGQKLSKLWQVVKQDGRAAARLMGKLQELLPESEGWSELFKQGDMAELLDLTRHLSSQQAEAIWLTAVDSLLNSEDAAALAGFYNDHPPAQKVLKLNRGQLKKNIMNACSEEINRPDDPDHLQAVLGDLYLIEEALNFDVRLLVEKIYIKIFEENKEGREHESQKMIYYYFPTKQDKQSEIENQLFLIHDEVDGMFSAV
ncbi:MAG: restriction endonuclease [Gammaproteobacteria bacterium]|nr:restriction endonuclease [Gammaproteobacteria bacterium]